MMIVSPVTGSNRFVLYYLMQVKSGYLLEEDVRLVCRCLKDRIEQVVKLRKDYRENKEAKEAQEKEFHEKETPHQAPASLNMSSSMTSSLSSGMSSAASGMISVASEPSKYFSL